MTCKRCRIEEHWACLNRRICQCLKCEKIKADVDAELYERRVRWQFGEDEA